VRAFIWLGAALVASAMTAGCRSAGSEQGRAATTSAPAVVTASATAQARAARSVAKIVFVGQREACDCTRQRIDTTWAALEQALRERPTIEVEKLERDVNEDEADRYDDLKPLMVAPGVYLLDSDGQLVELLQGKVTVAQLERALGGSTAASAGQGPG
jgi:hypothetical protein